VARVEEAIRSVVLQALRQEVRKAIAPLSKDVQALQRSVTGLERAVASLEKTAAQAPGYAAARLPRLQVSEKEMRRARLSPASIKKLRARLHISQAQLAAILGVTGPAVAQWEGGTSEPSGENRGALLALRKLGPDDARRMLESKGMRVRPARKTRRGRR
jgi:DNA-binding transcriptional regulator YiaG